MQAAQLKRIGAVAGIAYPVIQLVAQGLIQVGGAEPRFTAFAPEIVQFFQNRDAALFSIGALLSTFSLVVFLWFLGLLWSELRAVEEGGGFLSVVALGSGVATVSAYLSTGGWGLAMFRIAEGLDPQIARTLFDQGNLTFANTWVSLGSMVLAAGLLFRASGSFPKWLGWGSILLAIGLILARVVWTSQVAFFPYVLFWAWMITLGILFLRRLRRSEQHAA